MDPYKALKNKIMLAPMAGYTDKTMRKLCTEFGAGLTFTEMISSKALSFSSERTLGYLSFDDFKTGLQLFGNEPSVMADACKKISDGFGDKIAVFDVNMGCPAPKIAGNGDGSALMKNLPLAAEIVSSMVKATSIPVTAKIRKGWDETSVNAVEAARVLEAAGAAAITVHGRTRTQYYSGIADWDIIGEVKAAVSVPVIGNGDISSPEAAAKIMEQTGCDGVMIARAALGDPFIFRKINDYFEKGSYCEPAVKERLELAKRHVAEVCEDKGEYTGVRELRKHICFYVKGMRGGARIKQELVRAETQKEVTDILDSIIFSCSDQ